MVENGSIMFLNINVWLHRKRSKLIKTRYIVITRTEIYEAIPYVL